MADTIHQANPPTNSMMMIAASMVTPLRAPFDVGSPHNAVCVKKPGARCKGPMGTRPNPPIG